MSKKHILRVGATMRAAAELLGPAMFCPSCYGWVNTWHSCSFPMGAAYRPTSVPLEGGLTAETA